MEKLAQASSLCPAFPKHYFLTSRRCFPSTRDLCKSFVIGATRLTGWKSVFTFYGLTPGP